MIIDRALGGKNDRDTNRCVYDKSHTYLCVALALLITMVPLGPPNMHCRESYVHANHHMFETTLSPSFGRGLGLHSGLSALLELPGRQTPCHVTVLVWCEVSILENEPHEALRLVAIDIGGGSEHHHARFSTAEPAATEEAWGRVTRAPQSRPLPIDSKPASG